LVVPNYIFNEFRQHFRLTRATFETIWCYMNGLEVNRLICGPVRFMFRFETWVTSVSHVSKTRFCF
jgi:hypothetical protein